MIALDDTSYTEGIQRAATVSIVCGALACLASILLALVLHTEFSNWIQTHSPGNTLSAGHTSEACGCSTVKIEASHIDCASLSLSVLILITGMQCCFVASDTEGCILNAGTTWLIGLSKEHSNAMADLSSQVATQDIRHLP